MPPQMPLSKTSICGILLTLVLSPRETSSFTPSHIPTVIHSTQSTRLHLSSPAPSETLTDQKPKLLKRDRYIASNRFAVRKGKEAKFEKRWATRKSRLASLDGFRYFHLMRRVSADSSTDPMDDPFGNYVSLTIWNEKKNFAAWRAGDAFKEAHGGTSISAFLGTMIHSARTLKGPPRPAFYDGLLQQSAIPETVPETVDGWRNVEADGTNILAPECFVACNQFFVPSVNAEAFEKRWADRESALKECEGFVSFSMLRRDGSAKGHGTSPVSDAEPSYMTTTIWKDRDSFTKWKEGSAFKRAHSANNREGEDNKDPQPPAPLWSKPPTPVFYEATLVITSEDGA